MNTIKLIAVILILIVGVNFAFPEKSSEFRTKVFEAARGILARIPIIGEQVGGIAEDVNKSIQDLPEITEVIKEKIEDAQEITFATPLRGPQEAKIQASNVVLTESGVVSSTNRSRINNNLPTLQVNAKLNYAAKLKLQDMFTKQYFDHISKEGLGPADVVKKAGYEYILIGENLALGNFKNDDDLVTAWMNSPGHRANILHSRLTEIGVAVGKDFYEGKEVWIAVQEFGLPLGSCPNPDQGLRSQIDSNQNRLQNFLVELEQGKKEVEATPNDSPDYNEKIRLYNESVAAYNELLKATREIIQKYNGEVKVFNECLQG